MAVFSLAWAFPLRHVRGQRTNEVQPSIISLLKHDQMWSNPHKVLRSADSFDYRHKINCTNHQCNLSPPGMLPPLSCAINSSSKKTVRLFTIFQVELPLKFERICPNFSSLWLIYINFHQVRQVVLWISLDKLIHVSESEVIRNSQ